MIIVCDEETCAWRTRTWAFMVLWLFTAFMMGIALVSARHKHQGCAEIMHVMHQNNVKLLLQIQGSRRELDNKKNIVVESVLPISNGN